MPGQGKETKEKKKDETTALLRRLADEMTALRAEVDGIKSGGIPAEASSSGEAEGAGKRNGTRLSGEISAADDAAIARLGYAFSSAPKVALVRLLMTGGEQSSAQLGEQAGLTTGSLYHHLRELIHAGVLAQEIRNRYRLTERGRKTVLALLNLAEKK